MKRPRRKDGELRAFAAKQRWTADDAKLVLKALETSDSTITEFRQKYGVSHSRIFDWKRRLREDGNDSECAQSATFLPVKVVEDVATRPLIKKPVHSWAVELAEIPVEGSQVYVSSLARGLQNQAVGEPERGFYQVALERRGYHLGLPKR